MKLETGNLDFIEENIKQVWQYLCLWLLNFTILNTAAMMKNNSMGSNRMYWEMVMQPVSVETVKNKFILELQKKCMKAKLSCIQLSKVNVIFHSPEFNSVWISIGF